MSAECGNHLMDPFNFPLNGSIKWFPHFRAHPTALYKSVMIYSSSSLSIPFPNFKLHFSIFQFPDFKLHFPIFRNASGGPVDGVIVPLEIVFCDAPDGLVNGVIVISLDGSITLFRKVRLLRHPLYYYHAFTFSIKP